MRFEPAHHCAGLKIPEECATSTASRHPFAIRRNSGDLEIPESEFAQRFCYDVGLRTNCGREDRKEQAEREWKISFHAVRKIRRGFVPAMGRRKHDCFTKLLGRAR